MKKILLLLIMGALGYSLSAQDVFSTISGKINGHNTSLDSILVENLSNHTHILFGNLPNLPEYKINLTQKTFSAVAEMKKSEAGQNFLVKSNFPGTLVLAGNENRPVQTSLSVFNTSEQKIYEFKNRSLSKGQMINIHLGQPGLFIIRIMSKSGTQTFKAIGSQQQNNRPVFVYISGQSIPVQHVKTTPAIFDNGFRFAPGDRIRVSVYKHNYYTYPTVLKVKNSRAINFDLNKSTADSTGISDVYVNLNDTSTHARVIGYDTATGNIRIKYAGQKPNLKAGDIVTVDLDTTGYLRKVVSITNNDSVVTVTTTRAYLNDLFVNKEIKLSTHLIRPSFPLNSTSTCKDIIKALTDDQGYIHPVKIVFHNTSGKLITESALTNNFGNKSIINFNTNIATDLYGKKGSNAHFFITEGNVSLKSDAAFEFKYKDQGLLASVSKAKRGSLASFKFKLDSNSVHYLAKLSLDTKKKISVAKTKILTPVTKIQIKYIVPPNIPVWITIMNDIYAHYSIEADTSLYTDWGFKSNQRLNGGLKYTTENGFLPFEQYDTTTESKLFLPNMEGKKNESVNFNIYPHIEMKLYNQPGISCEITARANSSYHSKILSRVATNTNLIFLAWNTGLSAFFQTTVGGDLSFLGVLGKVLSPGKWAVKWKSKSIGEWSSPYRIKLEDTLPDRVVTGSKLNLTYKVTDSYGNPASKCPVYISGNGSFIPRVILSDKKGEVSVQNTLYTTDKHDIKAVIFGTTEKQKYLNGVWIYTYIVSQNTTSLIVIPFKADFSAEPTSGSAPLRVAFTDHSAGNPTRWLWDFGDDSISTAQNPKHTYRHAGIYTVKLTVADSSGTYTNTNIKKAYISAGSGSPIPLEWVKVDGGSFKMGSNNGGSDEKPVHKVTLSSFYITKYEITNAQFCNFLNAIEYPTAGKYNDMDYGSVQYINRTNCQIIYRNELYVPKNGKTNFPVTGVSWYGARAFAQWAGGRLPTEAEWEFAARGGNKSKGYTYSGSDTISKVAWTYTNSKFVHQVGTKAPNELGLYDMSGNAKEWCNDWYSKDYYKNSPQKNPQGPPNGPYLWSRVVRGGSAFDYAGDCHVTKRSGMSPIPGIDDGGYLELYDYYGFRIVAKQVPQLSAAFSSVPAAGTAPFTVSFYDLSPGNPTSWQWDFGDGSTSAKQNPVHTYKNPGSYTVKLTVTNEKNSDTKTKKDYITVETDTVNLKWINIDGGTFQMGGNNGKKIEGPIHQVTLRSFRLTKYEITNKQFYKFLNDIRCDSNGSFNDPYYGKVTYINLSASQILYINGQFTPNSGSAYYPITGVSWYGARAFAKWAGGRLPTEAEWEFAARGGNKSKDYKYSGSNSPNDVAWDQNNSGGHTHKTGTKAPNELGLYDMNGNVLEWCHDWYSSNYYSHSPQNNPQGPSNGTKRVLRGGSWYTWYIDCNSFGRWASPPNSTSRRRGFRIASDSLSSFFSATPVSGVFPLTVSFTDLSAGNPTSWAWDFGDGTTSTKQNPTHTYQNPGTFTVKLTVTNSTGSDTKTMADYITVRQQADSVPNAAFTATPDSGTFPLTVKFTDQSTNGATSWNWDFGDSTTSTKQNPTHTYQNPGTYTVKLIATNIIGSDTVTKPDFITVKNVVPETDFYASPTTGKVPLTVSFSDLSSGRPSSWNWDFGDNTTSTKQNPTHTYQKRGTYTVKLTATNDVGSKTITKTGYIIVNYATFTDSRDGKTYKTTKIGTQTWMAENLNYKTNNSWWYANDSSNGNIYGRLYIWDAAKNACPDGWHLPTDKEWKTLEMYLGMSRNEADTVGWRGTNEGKKMKSTSGWGKWCNGTNASGFNALPSGEINYVGGFDNLRTNGYWWSATKYYNGHFYRHLVSNATKIDRVYDYNKNCFSVRCVKDKDNNK